MPWLVPEEGVGRNVGVCGASPDPGRRCPMEESGGMAEVEKLDASRCVAITCALPALVVRANDRADFTDG